MESIPEKIKKCKTNLHKVQDQIRELKKLREENGLNPIQKQILFELDKAQKTLIENLKKICGY